MTQAQMAPLGFCGWVGHSSAPHEQIAAPSPEQCINWHPALPADTPAGLRVLTEIAAEARELPLSTAAETDWIARRMWLRLGRLPRADEWTAIGISDGPTDEAAWERNR